MTAAMLVLEPIFEADLQPEQNAYRPNRSALDAVTQVTALLRSHHGEVIDADLSGYFDRIPHAELMKSVARRISDRHMLRLIKMWLRHRWKRPTSGVANIERPGTKTWDAEHRRALRSHRC